MDLVLMRHGPAVDRGGADGLSDAERPLTERGAERTQAAARGLALLIERPEVVLTSPLVRAVQTATLAAAALGCADAPKVTDTLEPHRHPEDLLDLLAGMGPTSALCVGHAPHLDRVVAHLLGTERLYVTQLKKAGVARLRIEEGGATLLALLAPRQLRLLGR